MVSESQSAVDPQTGSVQVLAVTAGSGYASDLVDRLDGDEGFDITVVSSVNDAVEVLSSADDVECVVSDADTPEVDGVTFLQMVRVQHPDLPFFLFTSEAEGSVAARAMSARVTDYFVGERLEQEWERLADMIDRAVGYYRLQCQDPDRGTRIRDVLDALPDMVCIARDDVLVHANAAAEDLVGIDDRETLVDRPLSALFVADDAGGLAPLDSIETGERVVDRSETTMIDGNGDHVPVDLTAARIVWEDEPAVLIVTRDLTQRKEREAEMERVSDRYRTVHENIHEGLFLVDVEGDDFRYVDFNDRMLEITGLTAEEARGGTPSEVFGEEIRSTVKERYRECHDKGDTIDFEIEMDLPGGTRTLQTRLSPIVADGETIQIIGVSRDVTEEREREIELAEVKERFQNFVENASDIITVLDERGDIQYVSPAVEQVLGGSAGDYEGKNVLSDLVHPEDQDAALAMFGEVVEADPSDDISTSGEFRLRHADGGWIWTESTVSNAETDIGYVTVTRDVTERKEREAELERLKERFQAFVENTSDVITVVDQQGVITYVSPSVENVFGYTPEERLGVSAFEDIHPDDVDHVMETFSESVEEGEDAVVKQVEYRTRNADGDYVWVETSGNNVETEEGYVTVTRDISERKRSEQELRETTNVLESILDITPAAIFVKNHDGEYIMMNDECRAVMDVNEDDLGDVTDHDVLPEETARKFREDDRRVLESGVTEEIEEEIQTDDGLRTLLTLKSPIEYEEGEPPGICGVALDITDRKERELELERSEERLSLALETAAAGVYDYDAETGELTWDESQMQLFGIESEDFGGTYEEFIERIHEEDRALVEEAIETALARGERFDEEFRIWRDDGEMLWVQTSSRVFTEDGEPTRMIGVNIDVTDRKERELALGRSEERLSLALETAGAGIWEWSTGAAEAHWDASLERLMGFQPGEFGGTFEEAMEHIHPDDREGVQESLERAAERGERFEREFRVLRESGGVRWVLVSGKTLTGSDGEPDRTIGVAIDVTDRKEREMHLRVTDRLLRHNLRNDMNVILGHAETLYEETTEALRPHAQTIVETGDELLAKAEKERDVIEVLTDEPTFRAEDVGVIVRRTVETMRDAHPDATISLDAPEESVGVVSDRFGRAIEELVENGLLHSDREAPTLDVSVDVDEDTVTVRLADDGPGIPEKDLAVLSGGGQETPLEHGSGIGLWLVHWIVRRSDGTLDVEDNEPRGTVATVTVPRPDADIEAATLHADDGTLTNQQ